MEKYQDPEYIRENFPEITFEQVQELIKAGVVRRNQKIKKYHTLKVNEENGAILYYNPVYKVYHMAYYFIDPEHPKEKERNANR